MSVCIKTPPRARIRSTNKTATGGVAPTPCQTYIHTHAPNPDNEKENQFPFSSKSINRTNGNHWNRNISRNSAQWSVRTSFACNTWHDNILKGNCIRRWEFVCRLLKGHFLTKAIWLETSATHANIFLTLPFAPKQNINWYEKIKRKRDIGVWTWIKLR